MSGVRMIDTAASTRTLANAVIIEAFFALAWFSWGQDRPPAWESILLDIGAILAVLVTVGGIVIARRARHEPSPLSEPAAGKRYGIIVGTEFASIGIGAAIIGATGHSDFIAAWVCLVVGVHFVPLDRVFPGIGIRPCGRDRLRRRGGVRRGGEHLNTAQCRDRSRRRRLPARPCDITTGHRSPPHATPTQQPARHQLTRGRLVLVDGVLDLVAGVADLVLHRSGSPVDLALALQAVVVGQIARSFLGPALEIVCSPVAHGVSLRCGRSSHTQSV
jgi:hypothetical protein